MHHPRSGIPPPRGPPESSVFHAFFSKGSSNSLGSLAGPLEGHLESPWCPQGPKWLPKWPKMDTKTCPKRLPERKTQNVSKPYYLLWFNHILVLPSALKICLFSSKILPWLPWPSFGHQGVLNKPLGWHLQAILGIPGPNHGLPGPPQNHPKSLLKPGLPMGCPRHAPRLPHRPQKASKKTTK